MAGLGGAVAETERALGSAGHALQDLSSTPLVGEHTQALGDQVVASSADIVGEARGRRARSAGSPSCWA